MARRGKSKGKKAMRGDSQCATCHYNDSTHCLKHMNVWPNALHCRGYAVDTHAIVPSATVTPIRQLPAIVVQPTTSVEKKPDVKEDKICMSYFED